MKKNLTLTIILFSLFATGCQSSSLSHSSSPNDETNTLLDEALTELSLPLTESNDNFILPLEGLNNTTITWQSNNSAVAIYDEQALVTPDADKEIPLQLTAQVSLNNVIKNRTFDFKVLPKGGWIFHIVWNISVPERLPNAVYITTGSSDNSWNPSNLNYGTAKKINDTLYRFIHTYTVPTATTKTLEYKWTLQVPGAGFGPWSGEELNSAGAPISNRRLEIIQAFADKVTEKNDTVIKWRIPVKSSNSSVIGNLDIVSLTDERLPAGVKTRNIRIWTPDLPTDLGMSDLRYPVIYLHDGQNVFDSLTSFSGEWEVDETITSLMSLSAFPGAIVVGIDNSNERLGEMTYDFPYLDAKNSNGNRYGKLYMDFIIEIVKPYVDLHYPTLTGRQDTYLGGSSMGGLISFFGGLANLDVFGNILAFSSSTQLVQNGATNIPNTLSTLNSSLLLATKFFLYVGTTGDGDASWPEKYAGYLKNAGVDASKIKIVIGNNFSHNELAWRTHFPLAMEWLFNLDAKKDDLLTLLNNQNYAQDIYEPMSYGVYVTARETAQTTVDKTDPSLSEIVSSYGGLLTAINHLVKKTDLAPAKAVDDALVVLPSVLDFTVEDIPAYENAQNLFSTLTVGQKSLVQFYYVLDLLEAKVAELKSIN